MRADAIGCVESSARAKLASYLPTPAVSSTETDMDVDVSLSLPPSTTTTVPPTLVTPSEPSPEVDTYFRLLFILYLIDNKNIDKAKELAHETAEKIHVFNRRTLDPIASKVFFYLSRVHEIAGTAAEIRP